MIPKSINNIIKNCHNKVSTDYFKSLKVEHST